ncbi:MAG: hypothetical protein LUD16_11295 [Lachnospiraceae bacterium]|nr:hypothetical protein [Lachnospiraceae bacterium]
MIIGLEFLSSIYEKVIGFQINKVEEYGIAFCGKSVRFGKMRRTLPQFDEGLFSIQHMGCYFGKFED